MASPSRAETPDWSDYNTLLDQYVTTRAEQGIALNWVDYEALANDPAWARLIETLESFPTEKLAGQDEQLAFYINLYNIYAIRMVVEHWPLESIKDAGSFFKPVWKKTVGTLDGEEITLHEIEHEILRELGAPRIHMAIVCASLSCPDLRKQAYTADNIEAELEQVTQRFLDNPAKGYRAEAETIFISKIFDWFEEDFDSSGGVTGFLERYVQLPVASPSIRYMDYNWNLNGD